ncbi:PaaX family transcriptional regulator C-terminal domain-containing protein [Streptomyces sp. NPDC056716]|uniref:PaaX family transcriptional regulator n=1 Tax=unclassified Streptomyces TaxID=2593676 RepID=UPI0036CDEAEB
MARSEAADTDAYTRAAQPRQLIVTVYGLYAREEGGWLSVAALVELLGDLGVDEPALRSSISRLKRRGVLEAERRDVAGYRLSAEGLAILSEGDHRIFERQRATLADGWLLAVFSVPENERSKRHQLRSRLSQLGFGTAAPGVWIAPAHLHDTTAKTLRGLGLDEYAELFRADHLAFGDLHTKVRQWWDLDGLETLYAAFLAEHTPALERWSGVPATDGPGEPGGLGAFTDYVRLLTDWRRLPYLDPGLPEALLPQDWHGVRAAELFFTLKERLEDTARTHVENILARRRTDG